MGGNVKDLDLGRFEQALDVGDKLVVVEFYSNNCAFCAAVAPIYEALSHEMGDEAVFARINAQENPTLAQKFGVMGTPTFKFFCRKQAIGDIVGEVNITLLRNSIKDFIRHRTECPFKMTPLRFEMDGYG